MAEIIKRIIDNFGRSAELRRKEDFMSDVPADGLHIIEAPNEPLPYVETDQEEWDRLAKATKFIVDLRRKHGEIDLGNPEILEEIKEFAIASHESQSLSPET